MKLPRPQKDEHGKWILEVYQHEFTAIAGVSFMNLVFNPDSIEQVKLLEVWVGEQGCSIHHFEASPGSNIKKIRITFPNEATALLFSLTWYQSVAA